MGIFCNIINAITFNKCNASSLNKTLNLFKNEPKVHHTYMIMICLCINMIYLVSLYKKNRLDSIKELDVLLANTLKHS